MIREKKVFVYTILAVFVIVAGVGVLGAVGWLRITDSAIVTAILGPCLGIVVALLNAKHVFDDPEAITKLKEEHHQAILDIKSTIANDKAVSNESQKQAQAQIEGTHSKIIAEIKEAHVGAIAEMTQRAEKAEALAAKEKRRADNAEARMDRMQDRIGFPIPADFPSPNPSFPPSMSFPPFPPPDKHAK